jgi:aldose 1-epimerase
MELDSGSGTVQLTYASPDGEEGYPGAVAFTVTFRLEGPRLICEMAGVPDRPTPINLANHNYYNLGGSGTVQDHLLRIDAEAYTPTDAELIPTGEIRPLDGTPLDFSSEREIGDTPIDSNLVLSPERDRKKPAARARCPRTGRTLEIWTDEPALQLFDAPEMTIATPGHDGQSYGPFAGLCLEAQHFPDSVHHPDWPSILRTPDRPYFQRLVVEIARE